jgi:glucose/arabinose dehydrogenase
MKVQLFATNLMNPSHMEWTKDGRLLVSECTAGNIKDVTEGGDMAHKTPVAYGLKGPSSIRPLDDGRILVAEMWGGSIRDISQNGDVSRIAPFAHSLSGPYSIATVKRKNDGESRIYVT